jgi:phosphate transport system substrate-binding protein
MVDLRLLLRKAVIAALAVTVTTAANAEVRVRGSTTVAFGLMNPQKLNIEKIAGVKLTILPSSTAHGLADVVEGKAEIAMLAEPLETIAAVMNSKKAGFIDLSDYEDHHVGNAFVQFIVHPSNPLQTLSKAQLAGLFSGQLKNWREIGGADQPVLLVGEPTSTPHRMIKEALLLTYSSELRVVQNTNQTAIIVAQAPGALSYISTAHDLPIRDKLKVIQSDLKLPLALHLACRKDAPPEVKNVIAAVTQLGQY